MIKIGIKPLQENSSGGSSLTNAFKKKNGGSPNAMSLNAEFTEINNNFDGLGIHPNFLSSTESQKDDHSVLRMLRGGNDTSQRILRSNHQSVPTGVLNKKKPKIKAKLKPKNKTKAKRKGEEEVVKKKKTKKKKTKHN